MNNKLMKKYERVEKQFAPLKVPKRKIISKLAKIGRENKFLRYPILVVLVAFIFVYDLLYHMLIKLRVNERIAKPVALLLCFCLTFTSVYVPSYAVYNTVAGEKSCDAHMQHDETCGYVEAVEGTECSHVHTDECFASVLNCVHTHDDSCYEIEKTLTCELEEGIVADSESSSEVISETGENAEPHTHTDECYTEEKSLICTHTCSEETGCIAKVIQCSHVHDEECGYVEAVEGHACEHSCEKCDGSQVEKENIHGVNKTAVFDQSVVIDNIEISAYAPEGVIPADAVLHVEKITNSNQVAEIEQLIVEDKDNTTSDEFVTVVEQSYSFDITILDDQGNEVQPDTQFGTVEVTFKNVEVADAEADINKEVSAYHVSDDLNQAEEIPVEVSTTEDVASISAEHFSIYTVVITSGVAKDTILHYYQGNSKENSYFTLYNEKQLVAYRNLINGYQTGDVTANDGIATILINGDNANPMDGITGVGQATNMKIRDLNFSVKIMDDIDVNGTWAVPINVIPENATFDGAGHTITFNAVSGVAINEICGVLARTVNGNIKAVTIKWGDNTKIVPADGDTDNKKYASVSIRVNGEKCEIGQAITGSEALAASCDGENFITLQRSDDLSIYRVEVETLLNYGKTAEDLENAETPEGGIPETDDRVFDVYYAYEDENETISAATLSAENDYTAELNYVSVTYDLEGANTYNYKDGKLSENVMAAVRVDVKADGSYEAKEDYEVVVKAAEGYTVPTLSKNVVVKVNEVELVRDTDYTYTYDEEKEEGTLFVHKAKITGPMEVTVKADALEDVNPSSKLILHTKGGSVGDALWEKTAEYTYSMDAYKDVILPTDITAIKGSDSIRFDGWYDNINCTGTRVTKFTYSKTRTTKNYYAKWVLNKRNDHNNNVYYEYQSDGDLEVQGYPYNNGQGMITYYQGGFQHYYNIGSLSQSQTSGNQGGTRVNMTNSVGSDIFTQIGSSNVWVAMVCTLENSLVDITYIFENRNQSAYNGGIYFGMASDVDIAGDDGATIEVGGTDTKYFTMTARPGKTYAGQQFKLYTAGSSFGIDDVYSYWYGRYGSHSSKVYTNSGRETGVSDSALAFSWYVNNIPAGGCIKKTTKMGSANVSEMAKVTVKLDAVEGRFANGSQTTELVSNQAKFTVNANGTVTAFASTGNATSTVPTRTGYKFSHWSLNAQNEDISSSVAGKTYTENRTLYANWIPEPDKSVTNASQVKKVKGSDDLIVPKQIANIVIKNTTKGADVERIAQGETVPKAAGYASGFSATLLMEGEDTKYLLPDDIIVKIVEDSGKTTLLTKGTGYTYTVWDNRRKADLEIRKQYISGNVIIEASGYELPPNSANSVQITTSATSVTHGNKAVFIASAETSKNHAADYHWYVAPYHTITLDNKEYWDYQNQDGELLTNGTYTGTMLFQDSGAADGTITISGADKPTLRISGLDVCTFDGAPNESGLHKGGYHVYCVITSTRNITGEQIVTASKTAELEVVSNRHPIPTGLEGSAPSFYGASDGSILIEAQNSRPAMQYKMNTQPGWTNVTAEQLAAGEISGLRAGTYQFWYPADANNEASAIVSVVVEDGRYITVTYKADGCDDPALRTQVKHVAYGDTFGTSTASKLPEDGTIQNPARAGYTFTGWSQSSVENITDNMTITANYAPAVYKLTLNNHGADAENPGSNAIFEKYSVGFFAENTCENVINGVSKITLPKKAGYDFLGYFTEEGSGIQMICADGCLSENLIATKYMENTTLHAQWKAKKIDIRAEEGVTLLVTATPDPANPDKPGNENIEEIEPDKSYDITLTKEAEKDANVIYIYSNGALKQTITDVAFDADNNYKFTLVPSTVGGGAIVLKIGYIEPKKDGGEDKTEEEKKTEAEEQARAQNYLIQYMDVDGTKFGGAFTGTFTSTKPVDGVLDVATVLPEVTKTGYNFGGWYLAARGTGTKITEIPANITVTESESGVKYVTVYAKWNANKYNVTLIPGTDATISSDYVIPAQYTHGAAVNPALPSATEITRENHAFKGWYETEAFSGNPVSVIDCSKVGDITYYAKWEILSTHTVILPTNGANGRIFSIAAKEGYETTVYDGKEFKFTVTPASAYGIRAVKVNSKIITADANGVYTISNITDDVTVTVDFSLLASTEENTDAVATIALADGTTGYFTTLDAAISYAAKYGANSVIKLLKDQDDTDLEIPSGRAFTLDLNGHTIGDDAQILVLSGADFRLADNAQTKGSSTVTIENYGIASSAITVAEVKNYGTYTNDAVVTKMTQGESESSEKSKFVNNGTITTAKIESGYFVENNLSSAPAGLSGYHTIMNGNEYYFSFQDAVDIANVSDSDASILMLETLDNRNAPISIGNANNKKITVNMEGFHIYNASITTTGDVAFMNANGNSVNPSKIDATIDNKGALTIGAYVSVKRALKNETDADITVENNAQLDGDVTNDGEFTNNGTVTGVLTNNGDIENNGRMNNVSQEGGNIENNGTANKVEMKGGSYTPSMSASPQVPSNPVIKTNTSPATYYGTFKDAVEDINSKPAGDDPVTLIVLKNITDLGGNPIAVDPTIPVSIDLDGHTLGDGTQIIQFGDGNEQSDEKTPVIITNSNPESGEVKAPVKVKDDVSVTVDDDTILAGNVTNEGDFTNKGNVTGTFTNTGNATNEGTMDKVVQEGGSFVNEETGTINDMTQTGGTSTNEGAITDFNQDGGIMDNQGDITNPNVDGGGFTGNGSGNSNVKKEAYILEGENKKYFATIDEALEYASKQNPTVTVYLDKDIDNENVDLTGTDNPVILDLNGHSIGTNVEFKTGEGTDITIKNSDLNNPKNGEFKADVENNGNFKFDDGVKATGDIVNKGKFENDGVITGAVSNDGVFENDGKVDATVTQNSGTYINNGTTTEINLDGGGIIDNNDSNPTTINGGVAKIGDEVFGTLEDAVEFANDSEEDVTIILVDDVTLPVTPAIVVENENGKKITIDLNGKDINGGIIQVGDGEDNEGVKAPVVIKDSAPGGGKGTVNSKVIVSEDGDVTNNADITGDITNNGDFTNNGEVDKVIQEAGTFTNTDTGKAADIEQNGGKIENEGTIENAKITGGEYVGDEAGSTDREGAKAAVVKDGKTTYYPTVQDAIDALGTPVPEGAKVVLFDDVTENITISKPGVMIDINGHSINAPGKITVTEGATSTTITDSNPAVENGVKVPVENNGELTIDSGVKAEDVTNNGTFENKGTVTKLSNEGEAINTGSITTLEQDGGSFDNKGTIGTSTINGGSYIGTEPGTSTKEPVAKIGAKTYADIESAIKDANKAATDVVIEVLGDASLPASPAVEIGNENGKKITIDLNGNDVDNGTLSVVNPGNVVITDDGNGTFAANVNVANGATFEVAKDVTVDGNIENSGTIVNKGAVTGSVANKAGATFTNDGTDSYVGGDVTNAGQLTNAGVIAGDVDNTGTLVNTGNLDSDINNRGTGSFDNNGSVNGQLINKDNATAENSGHIHQISQTGGSIVNTATGDVDEILQTGGKIENNGEITKATVSDIKKFAGNLPKNGLSGVAAILEYTDESGNAKREFYDTLDSVIEAANQIGVPTTITVAVSPLKITGDKTIGENTTLVIPEDKSVVVEGGKLINNGTIDNAGTISSKDGGSLDNKGTVDNNGTISTPVTNEGAMTNTGTVSGDVTNNGTLSNEGNGKVTKPVTNTGTIENKDNAEFVGGVKTTGTGTLTDTNAKHEASYEDESGNTIYTGLSDALSRVPEGGTVTVIKNAEIKTDTTVKPGVTLTIPEDKKVTVDEGKKLTNNGTVGGSGTLDNKGTVDNKGTISAPATNEGTMTNTGTVSGSVTNEGTMSNTGTVTGGVTNKGTMTNTGTVSGDVTNNGTLSNEGNGKVTKPVTNTGTIENKDNAEFVGGVKTTGTGTITDTNTKHEASYEDESGNTIYTGLSDALSRVPEGGTVTVIKNAEIKTDTTVKPGVTLTIPEDKKVTVDEGKKLTNKGTVGGSGTLDNKGTVDNKGTISAPATNEGTMTNAGTVSGSVTNEGTMTNTGTVSGDVTNEGTMTNNGTVSGEVVNTGTLDNKGTVSGKVENKTGGTLTNDATGKVTGDITNTGTTNNKGTVEGKLDNQTGGKVTNDGTVSGDVTNTGTLENKGTVEGKLDNQTGGKVTNDGTVSGDVENTGTLDNKGTVSGKVENKTGGTLTNDATGKVTGDITNTGTTNNKGTVEGKLDNQTGGSATNDGTILGDVTNAGTLENKGTVSGDVENSGDLSNTGKVTGDLDNTGSVINSGNGEITKTIDNKGTVTNKDDAEIPGGIKNTGDGKLTDTNPDHVATYTDKDGIRHTTDSLQDAIDKAGSEEGTGQVNVINPITITDNTTIPKDITVDIEPGGKVEIPEGTKLTNEGKINNDGTFENKGTLENKNKDGFTNTGDFTNKGDIKKNDVINKGEGSITEGNIKLDTPVTGDGAPNLALTDINTNAEKALKKVMTPEEKQAFDNNETMVLRVKISEAGDSIGEEEEAALKKKAGTDGDIATILDVVLLMKVGNQPEREVSEITGGGKVKVVIDLNEIAGSINTDYEMYRNYRVFNSFNGAINVIYPKYDEVNQTLTFEIGSFHTLALAYNDVKRSSLKKSDDDDNENSDDETIPGLTIASGAGTIGIGIGAGVTPVGNIGSVTGGQENATGAVSTDNTTGTATDATVEKTDGTKDVSTDEIVISGSESDKNLGGDEVKDESGIKKILPYACPAVGFLIILWILLLLLLRRKKEKEENV